MQAERPAYLGVICLYPWPRTSGLDTDGIGDAAVEAIDLESATASAAASYMSEYITILCFNLNKSM